eukprot:g18662.t1
MRGSRSVRIVASRHEDDDDTNPPRKFNNPTPEPVEAGGEGPEDGTSRQRVGGGGGGGEVGETPAAGRETGMGDPEAGDGEGGPGEKRKRKRTRTRKRKGGAAAAAAGEDDEAVGVDGEGGGGSAAGGGGAVGGTMTDTVYVEGIPWTCDESDVREFFKGCGKITDVRMPRWNDSGRPRGYAHVAFAGTGGARAAFGRDGRYLNGRYLTVQAPQEPATEKARRANRKAEQPAGCKTVFVKNLPYDADEAGVNEALSGCGRIVSVRLAVWNHTQKLKGFGYVEFASERGAESCVRKQESLSVGGRPLVVDFETGAPKGSFRRQDGAQIKKTSADAGVGNGKPPKFKVHA